MRIAYFIACPQRLAGANRSLLELIENLPPGFDPLVIFVAESNVFECYRARGIPVCSLAPTGPLNAYGGAALRWSGGQIALYTARHLVPYTLRAASLFRRERIDLVHVNDARGALLAGPAARIVRKPLVAHQRGEAFADGGVYWRTFERLPIRIITVCNAIQSGFCAAARKRCRTVYNGIRANELPSGPGVPWLELERERGKTILVCLASVVPFKAHHHLLDAVAELNARGLKDEYVLACVGDIVDRRYHGWLLRRREQLGVTNVTFTGWTDDPLAYYRSADISVMVSISRETLTFDGVTRQVQGEEGFPRTHLEAMSYSLPIVGTDVAGVREQVVDGVTGYVVPAGRPHAIADVLERLVGDPGLRRAMGAAAKERVVSRFSTAAHVSGVISVYREAMQAHM